jgi:hypothetical protein
MCLHHLIWRRRQINFQNVFFYIRYEVFMAVTTENAVFLQEPQDIISHKLAFFVVISSSSEFRMMNKVHKPTSTPSYCYKAYVGSDLSQCLLIPHSAGKTDYAEASDKGNTKNRTIRRVSSRCNSQVYILLIVNCITAGLDWDWSSFRTTMFS